MQPLLRRRIYLGSVFAAILAAGFVVYRPGIAPEKLMQCLPAGDDPVVYVDLVPLRRVGLLDQVAGKAGGEEADYLKFVSETGFDYRRDLDAVAASWHAGAALFVVKGRFDLGRLQAYARAHGGQCAGEFCSLSGSVPERKISFQPLARSWGDPWFGSRLLAVGSGPDAMAAAAIRRAGGGVPSMPPAAAVWLGLPGSALHAQDGLPVVVNALLDGLQGATRATFELGGNSAGLTVELTAACPNVDQAREVTGRLERATTLVRTASAAAGSARRPDPLAQLLAGGSFRIEQSVVRGTWNVPVDFLKSLSQ